MGPAMRVFAVAFLSLLPALGCGGSSSETPPPLEPDPTSGRYTGPRVSRALEDASPPASAEPALDEESPPPSRPGRATWGSGRAAPTPTPSAMEMTSPNAPQPKPSGSAPVN